jgi:hypothetical protein
MDLPTLLNLTAIGLSVAALAVSTFFASRQLRSAQASNSTLVAIELLTRETRTEEFLESEDYVWNKLSDDYSAEGGVSGLPLHVREHVIRVGFYYSGLGIMAVFKAVEPNLLISTVYYRVTKSWLILSPYIARERELRGSDYLGFFEHLACLCTAADVPKLRRRLRLQKFDGGHGSTRDIGSTKPKPKGPPSSTGEG